MRRGGVASISDGASLLRRGEARKLRRKLTGSVVGHNSKITADI